MDRARQQEEERFQAAGGGSSSSGNSNFDSLDSLTSDDGRKSKILGMRNSGSTVPNVNCDLTCPLSDGLFTYISSQKGT